MLRFGHARTAVTAAAVAIGASTVTAGSFLVDYGTEGGGSGYAVSGANAAFGGFTQFQPFTIPAGEIWHITSIGADGFFTSNPAGSVGPEGALLGDDNGMPDEGDILLSGFDYAWDSFANGGGWVDAVVDITLGEGTYWVRLEAPDPDYVSTWRNGLNGPDGISRRNGDGETFVRPALAMRIGGEIVPAPGAAALLGIAAMGLRRRRRTT